MKKTRIFLIRHGQSIGNLNQAFLGHTDLDLSEMGYYQAERVGEYLKGIPADRIYSSDLMRAYHTACPAARLQGLPITKKEQLREIFAGEWEGKRFLDLERDYPESYHIWCRNTALAHPDGGEKVTCLAERFSACVKAIAEENEGKTVLIFAHATPIRIMACLWSGRGLKDLEETPWPPNVSVTEGAYENGEFSLVSYGYCGFLDAEHTTRQEDEA